MRLAAWLLLLAGPLAGQTSLSIYSDGMVVVRRTLPQALAKGRNTATVELEATDPASVFSPDTAVTVLSAVLRGASDRGSALESAVGQTLAFVRAKGDTVRATVVRASPPQYRLADGRVLLVEPGEPLFPGELVRTAPMATLVLEAARTRPTTDLAYVIRGAGGASWSATYHVLVSGGQATVWGVAMVASQGLRAESADVQLVAGTINRARGNVPVFASGPIRAAMVADAGYASEEAIGETHVYTLPGRLTLERGVTTAVALFPRATVPVTRDYVVSGALPLVGYVTDQSNQAEPNRVPVDVWYTLARARGTAFGERPLPGGVVRVYQADSAGQVQLVGEAQSAHTAPGRDLRVLAGTAFDLTAERVETEYTQEQIAPPPPAQRPRLAARQRVTVSYRVTISNAKPEGVTVDVREARSGTWRVTASSVPAEKLSAGEVRFRVPVPANGRAVLTYTVQVES